HNTTGLYHGHPVLRGTLTGTHAGLSGLLSDGLVGENLNPDLTATLGVTGHSNTGSLDLIAGNPAGLGGYQAKLTVSDSVATGGLALHATAVNAAILYALRQQHY